LPTGEVAQWLISSEAGSHKLVGPSHLEGFPTKEEQANYIEAKYRSVGGDYTEEPQQRLLKLALGAIHQDVCDWLTGLIIEGIDAHYFKHVNGWLGYTFADALTKAEAGDVDALLAIVRAFPDAMFDSNRPFIQERLKALLADPDFRIRFGEAFAKPIKRDGRMDNPDLNFTLSCRPDLIEALRDGKVTADEVRSHLISLGVKVDMSAKSLGQRIRRDFRGGDEEAS
jgi:hypothetical protein